MSQVAYRWVVALPAEARAIRARYEMQSAGAAEGFKFFRCPDGIHWLVICGVGRARCAAGTQALLRASNAPPWAVWLNIGICGHGSEALGKVLLAHKIIDKAQGKAVYPGLVYARPCPTTTVVTVDEVERSYADPVAYDMEAAAFYAVARQHTATELIAVLKIVSDNRESTVESISRESVLGWMQASVPVIEALVKAMARLSEAESVRLAAPDHLSTILKRWRFSVSLEHQLTTALRRWAALCPDVDPMIFIKECSSSRAVIARLGEHLDQLPVDWTHR